MLSVIKRAFVPETWPERIYWSIVGLFAAVVLAQLFDRAPASIVIDRYVLTPSVPVGGYLQIRNVSTPPKFKAEVTIYRTLYDGINVRWDFGQQELQSTEAVKTESGDNNIYDRKFLIPPAAAPGPSRLLSTVCWQRPFNLIHRIWPVCTSLKTVTFEIVQP